MSRFLEIFFGRGGYAVIFKLLGNMSAQSGGIDIFEAHVFSG